MDLAYFTVDSFDQYKSLIIDKSEDLSLDELYSSALESMNRLEKAIRKVKETEDARSRKRK